MSKSNLMKKTKPQLVTVIEQLKRQVLDNRDHVEERESKGSDLDKSALGVAFSNGQYSLIILKYNLDSKEAQVVSIIDTNTPDADLVQYRADEFLSETIMNEAEKDVKL